MSEDYERDLLAAFETWLASEPDGLRWATYQVYAEGRMRSELRLWVTELTIDEAYNGDDRLLVPQVRDRVADRLLDYLREVSQRTAAATRARAEE